MNFFKEENRLASILHVIETGPDTQVEKLASQLSVSTKTVKNDIKELNALLSGHATIANAKGNCKLIVFDQTIYNEIRNKIFEQNDLFNSVQTRMAYISGSLCSLRRHI